MPIKSKKTPAPTPAKLPKALKQPAASQSKHSAATSETRHDKLGEAAKVTQRHFALVNEIPRGSRIGTTDLQTRLQLLGFDVHLRTLQRDLIYLSQIFPIEHDNSNPKGWSFKAEAELSSFPKMSVSEAVVFTLAEQNLQDLLPKSLMRQLRPWFELARKQLSTPQGHWADQVRYLPASQPLIGPEIHESVQDAVYESLIKKKTLLIDYRKRRESEPKSYELQVLAVVQRGASMYLIAKDLSSLDRADQTDLNQEPSKMFALHRIESATPSDRNILAVNFDLDDYLSVGNMDFLAPDIAEGPIPIELHFTQSAGFSLTENRISLDQTTETLGDRIIVKATVTPTQQLVWWLRGFGGGLLEVHPEKLRLAVDA
jgi:predicted DNA-binding transcriptional regulator YafY